MSTTQERVYGPYPDRGRYRVVVIDGTGRRCVESFASADEAAEFRRVIAQRATTRTVQDAVTGFVEAMRRRGCVPESATTATYQLEGIHLDALAEPLSSLSTDRAESLYAAYAAGHAVDTHRSALSKARSAAALWVRLGWLASNPWTDVEGTGRRRRRKRQLRTDDARKLVTYALSRAEADLGALAVATQLLLALRSSELCRIEAAHLDDGGKVLVVPIAKTHAGEREIELPAVLQPLLAARAAQSARLFPHRRWWVRDSVSRICLEAGVEPVTAHALRGMHATIAIRRGVSSHVVAAALGHATPRVTMAHYAAAGVVRDLLGSDS